MASTIETNKAVQVKLDKLLQREWRLSYHGFSPMKDNDPRSVAMFRAEVVRDTINFHADVVRRAVAWLLWIAPEDGGSSYDLKHQCEEYLSNYVSNGEIIAAAYLAGWHVEVLGLDNPNAVLTKKKAR